MPRKFASVPYWDMLGFVMDINIHIVIPNTFCML